MNQSQNFALSYGLDAVSALNNGFWDGFMFCEVAMVLGDGIRRNIGSVDTHERALLRDALVELNKRHFPGIRTDVPSSGVSCWFKEDEIHADTHVHGGPEFLPWHRELVNRMEEMLRVINPQLSLHYWDWTQDPRGIPNANLGGGDRHVEFIHIRLHRVRRIYRCPHRRTVAERRILCTGS
jgi:Common central domain of tyrosinase